MIVVFRISNPGLEPITKTYDSNIPEQLRHIETLKGACKHYKTSFKVGSRIERLHLEILKIDGE